MYSVSDLIGNHLSMISFISKWRRNNSKIKFCGIKMMKNSIKNQCIIILDDDYNPITSNQVISLCSKRNNTEAKLTGVSPHWFVIVIVNMCSWYVGIVVVIYRSLVPITRKIQDGLDGSNRCNSKCGRTYITCIINNL